MALNATQHPKALRFGYQVEACGRAFRYIRPDGEADSEPFGSAEAAADAAEFDAALWEQDHGAGVNALEAIQLCKRYAADLDAQALSPNGDDFNALLRLLEGGPYTAPHVHGR